jgi:hypothetical protein
MAHLVVRVAHALHDARVMHEPHPDRFGPTAVKSIALWLSVGAVILLAFLLLFPKPSP